MACTDNNVVKAAVVQSASVIMNREATVKKVALLTQKAATLGAKVVLFPEAFIPAYPRGLSFGFVVGSRTMEGREDWLRYYKNSVLVPGPTTKALGKAAQENRVYLSVGVVERGELDGTLYCTTLYFGPSGKLLGKHRKLKPTGSERLVWGEGDGSTLSVIDTPYGRMGGLICWENYMPLARTALYDKGVSLYLAPTADAREEWQATIRHIALEGRCFVLSCNQFVTKDMYPTDLNYYYELESQPEIMSRGGSAIISPMGEYLAGPVYDKEDILIAELDLDLVIKSRLDFDPTGHYARPDVFEFKVKE